MKALSIKQPWASLIAHGIKDIENRTWKTHFRGKIFIHASAKPVEVEFGVEQSAQLWLNGFDQTTIISKDQRFPTSAIIGEVEIVDCVINHSSIWAEKTNMSIYPAKNVIYNWVLANVSVVQENSTMSKWNRMKPQKIIARSVGMSFHLLSQGKQGKQGKTKKFNQSINYEIQI